MNRCLIFGVVLVVVMGLGCRPSHAQASPPVIYYLDILSGPNTGGESNNGVILTIYGKNFGSSQGTSTVTVGGGAVATYKRWCSACDSTGLHDMISVAIGGSAATGAVVITVGGQASYCENHDANEGCTFTVVPGNIFYISPTGNDSASGSFAAPWASLNHADATISPGDTVYIENGFQKLTCDGQGWHAAFTGLTSGGTSGHREAYIVYPGATATLGVLTGGSCGGDSLQYGIRNAGAENYVTFAGWTIRSPISCLEGNNNNFGRYINIDCASTGPAGASASFVFQAGNKGLYLYGNNLHDVSSGNNTTRLNSCIYFGTSTSSIFPAWNKVGDGNTGCQTLLEVHSTGGNEIYDVHIHDNILHGGTCVGMNISTVDPSKGVVEIYNNIVYHTGAGPNPTDSSCYYNVALAFTNAGDVGAGVTTCAGNLSTCVVDVYNNTFYDAGSIRNTQNSGASWGMIYIANNQGGSVQWERFTNNILYPTTAEGLYFTSDTLTSQVGSCANNDFFQAGVAPLYCNTGALSNVDPKVVSTSTADFRLQSTSPLLGVGLGTHLSIFDFDGNPRPKPPAIGAYDLPFGGVYPPNPPANLSIVVQ